MFSIFLPTTPFYIRALLDSSAGFVLVYLFRTILRRRLFSAALSHLPEPKAPSWILGHDWAMINAKPGKHYLEWAKEFGGAYKFRGLLRSTMVVFTDRRALSHILDKHVYDYPKPAGARAWFLLLLGKGVLWAEGEEHAHQRKILGPAFNQAALRELSSIFYDSAYKAVDKWNEMIDKDDDDTVEIDVQYWTNRISLDSIGLAGFSYDFECLSGKTHPLASTLDSLTDSSSNSFTSWLLKALLFTFPSILKIPSKRAQLLRESRRSLGNITSSVWKEAVNAGEKGESGKTILEMLVKADLAIDSGDKMGEEEISAEIMTLIFAGYETTSCILSWALWELAHRPEMQSKLREEVSASPSDPSFDELHTELPYLDAVVNETIRLHPPVLDLHRVAEKDDVIPLSAPLPGTNEMSVSIPKGTLIAVPLNVLQSDVFGPDAREFRPERWEEIDREEEEEKKLKTPGYVRKKLWAFSDGDRTCIGRTFAMIEIKAVLATLLRHFSFAPVEGKEIEPFVSFVVRPRIRGERKSSLPLMVSRLKY